MGCALPASEVGAGLLRVKDPVVLFVVVDNLVKDVEVDLSEEEGSPWPIELGSIWVVDGEFS